MRDYQMDGCLTSFEEQIETIVIELVPHIWLVFEVSHYIHL